MNLRERLRNARLLLVTDPRPDLATRVAVAVRGGVDIVQIRDKHASREELLPLASELKEICEQAGALFTVNDDVELARLSDAHAVHVVFLLAEQCRRLSLAAPRVVGWARPRRRSALLHDGDDDGGEGGGVRVPRGAQRHRDAHGRSQQPLEASEAPAAAVSGNDRGALGSPSGRARPGRLGSSSRQPA